jgi:DNA-binding LacI/PurR family transcriptional regulator
MTKLSIDDVAKAAGVHRSTVSRAFSRPEAVKAATREHVLRVAEELGYTMSPVARALRHGTTPLVPLVVPDVINPFYAELAESMTQAAGERGYQLLLCITDGSDVRTAEYLTAVHSLYAPFGVIAPSTRVNFERLRQFGFGDRVVVIDRVAEGSEVPSVTVDSRRGIELAFEHLRGLGHERIGYVSGISGTYTAHDRMTAYLELAGPALVVLDGGSDSAAGRRAVAHYLALPERPTAIIAANDMTAFGLIAGLAASGVRVPADVSVVGFDGLMLGERFNPALTTIRQPIAEMGGLALDLAEKKAAEGVVDHVVLAPEMLERSSTAAPPS